MTTTLTPDERLDLRDLYDIPGGWPALLAHVTELCGAYYAAGLVEGDLGHDGTIRAEASA